MRGAAPEHGSDEVNYPGAYLAGVYNRLTSTVQGREVEDEHLVNSPNWLLLDLCIDGGGWWGPNGPAPAGSTRPTIGSEMGGAVWMCRG